VSDEVRT